MAKATLPGAAGALGGMLTGPVKGSKSAIAPRMTPTKGLAPKTGMSSPRKGPMVLSPSRSGAGMGKGTMKPRLR